MSLKFLYGFDYNEYSPPKDWPSIGVQATINDDAFESEITTQEFTFAGTAATFIENDFIPIYGVFVGCPLRIQANDNDGNVETIFDGMIALDEREILSESNPILFRAPIEELNNNVTVFDRIQIITQGLLKKEGYFTQLDYVDVPVIRESKKNIAERAVILGQLGYQVVSTFIGAIQDFLSAISDVIGVSVVVGLVEILLLFVNTAIQINLLMDKIYQHKDLFFPLISYYKGISFRSIIDRGFEKLGRTVEYGIIEPVLDKIYLLGSQHGFDGFPAQGFPNDGILKSNDPGYRVGNALEILKSMCNTRELVNGNTVHIKTKSDPYWTGSPAFTVDDTLNETTEQYSNGTKKEDTEEVKAVTYISYTYDPTDAHTLTENQDDSHEIHRKPINLPDERFNRMRRIQDIQIPYAMAVRKTAFDNLWDLFTGISDDFDFYIEALKNQIISFASSIDPSQDPTTVNDAISSILAITGLGILFENRNGCLKIDDNAYGVPKIMILEDYSVGKRIPSNFKSLIGAKALYDNYYFPESPADVNNYAGQKILRKSWGIPFNLKKYQLSKVNPFFQVNTTNAKFRSINWEEDNNFAVTDAEQQHIFDSNITEEEI